MMAPNAEGQQFRELQNAPDQQRPSSSGSAGQAAPQDPAQPGDKTSPRSSVITPSTPVSPDKAIPHVEPDQTLTEPDQQQMETPQQLEQWQIVPTDPNFEKPDQPAPPEQIEENIITAPDKESAPPQEKPEALSPDSAPTPDQSEQRYLTPGHFLLKTPESETKTEEAPMSEEKSGEPLPPEPQANQTPPEPKEDQAPPLPEEPPAEEQKPDPNNPQKGDPLQIPEEAKETGDVSFLEGCWVGTRPEYYSKRIVTERFCFDKSGVGKRFIIDPGVAGECVGATRAVLNQGGVLHMSSESMYCTEGYNWGSSDMVCEGEGNQTPCTWVFHDAGGGRQSYKIRFVKE